MSDQSPEAAQADITAAQVIEEASRALARKAGIDFDDKDAISKRFEAATAFNWSCFGTRHRRGVKRRRKVELRRKRPGGKKPWW